MASKHPEPPDTDIINKVMLQGDLSGLTEPQRVSYYKKVCETLGLNPLTKPFDYIELDGKLQLYAKKDATEQLRKRYDISVAITHREKQETIYIVTSKATLPSGRTDESIGAVAIVESAKIKRRTDGSWGWADNPRAGQVIQAIDLANAVMKAETKAKRRVTLSICGIGMLDESELDTVTSPPANDSSAILERNVREATAHATGEVVVEQERQGFAKVDGKVVEPTNEFGPLSITADNYRELKSHVGRAQGNMLGYKVGELHRNQIEWMYKNWREKLQPSASDQDMRLSKAIQFAFHAKDNGIAGDTNLGVTEGSGTPKQLKEWDESTAKPEDKAARQACITDLRQRIEELVLTEEQACGYLHKFGLFGQGWTSFNDAPTNLLLHLCTPLGWKTFWQLFEKEVKPKVVEKPVRKGRKRAK